jgi:hypothetical protein
MFSFMYKRKKKYSRIVIVDMYLIKKRKISVISITYIHVKYKLTFEKKKTIKTKTKNIYLT